MTLLYQPFYRAHGATTWIPFGSPIPSVSVAITGLSPTTAYDFEVIATNSFGSATSATISATTTAVSGIPPPGSVSGTQNSGAGNPQVTGPATGSAATSGTLAVTGITISDPNVMIYAGSGLSITDGSGAVWTISPTNTVLRNGAAAGFTANVAVIALVAGTIWHENTTGSWFSWNGTTWTGGAAPVTSTNSTLTITTTGGTLAVTDPTLGIVVLAGSGQSFTDSSGNVWTISPTNTVLINGASAAFSANVAEIAYVKGVVWQENTSNQWFSWNGSAWTAGSNPIGPTVVTGNGTASVTISTTLAFCQAAAASLVLTAPASPTTVNIKVAFFDPTAATASITIPVAVGVVTPPTAPTSLLIA